jgi:hypothetical protein
MGVMKNKIVISIISIILLISILSLCLCACNPSTLSGTYKNGSIKIIFKSDGSFECEGLSWWGNYEIFDGTQVSVRIYSGSSYWKETWTLSKDRKQLKTSSGYVYNRV